MLRKEGEIQKADLNNGLYFMIILSCIQAAERAAEVAQGPFRPVIFIYDLHFQIDNDIVVQDDLDIQDKGFLVYGHAKLNGIGNHSGFNLFRLQVKQRTDQAPENLIVALQQRAKQIIIGHGYCHRAGSRFQEVRRG